MNRNPTSFTRPAASSIFDLLRARLESDVSRPAVIALTSCTSEDGRDLTARALAFSLAAAGYSTLFADSSLASTSVASSTSGLAIEEIGRRQNAPDGKTGQLATLTLNDPTLQSTTSQRGMQSGFEILRSKFDYVVITVEAGVSTAFATTVISNADAILVCVKTGRRETADDLRLSDILDRLGPRYLGIIAVDPSFIQDVAVDSAPSPNVPLDRVETEQHDAAHRLRKMADSPRF